MDGQSLKQLHGSKSIIHQNQEKNLNVVQQHLQYISEGAWPNKKE